MIGYDELRKLAESEARPLVILFGTGWGLTDDTVARCERMLAPIKGSGDYNHFPESGARNYFRQNIRCQRRIK
jgi:hypothetical protein